MAKISCPTGKYYPFRHPKRFESTPSSEVLVIMALGSGIRLNSAMSILLVALLILGGMASMSSLEMSDASASGGNENSDDSSSKSNLKAGSNAEWLDKCKDYNLDDSKADWLGFNERSRTDFLNIHRLQEVSEDAEGRESADNNTAETESDEVDWHLPDYVTVVRTEVGYTISIIDAGVTNTENYTEEEFAIFLERFGWESEEDESAERERDRDEIRERVADLREACENGDGDSCRELRGLMERFRQEYDQRDRHERDPPALRLDHLDDGTIIAHREFSDGSIQYDIISTADDGEITVVRVSAWGTEVIHPQEKGEHRKGEFEKKDTSDSFHKFSSSMSEEDIKKNCQEFFGDSSPRMDIDFDRLERVPVEQKSERR